MVPALPRRYLGTSSTAMDASSGTSYSERIHQIGFGGGLERDRVDPADRVEVPRRFIADDHWFVHQSGSDSAYGVADDGLEPVRGRPVRV